MDACCILTLFSVFSYFSKSSQLHPSSLKEGYIYGSHPVTRKPTRTHPPCIISGAVKKGAWTKRYAVMMQDRQLHVDRNLWQHVEPRGSPVHHRMQFAVFQEVPGLGVRGRGSPAPTCKSTTRGSSAHSRFLGPTQVPLPGGAVVTQAGETAYFIRCALPTDCVPCRDVNIRH